MGSPPRRRRDEDTTTRLGLPDARLQVERIPARTSVSAEEPARVHATAVRAAVAALRASLPGDRAGTTLRRADPAAAWDLELRNDRGERIAIAVRGTPDAKARAVAMTAAEWTAARRLGTRYWLVLVTELDGNAVVGAIQNPAGQVQDRTIDVEPTAWRLTWPLLGRGMDLD